MPLFRPISLLLVCGLWLLPVRSLAAEVSDLGEGLAYLRVSTIEEAFKSLAGNSSLVLDLRQTSSPPEMIARLGEVLGKRIPGTPLFVLVSPDTPPALARAWQGKGVTLGVTGCRPAPQVPVAQSTEEDRRACAALAAGTPLTELITGKVEKDRYDEATLVQEFKGGNHDAKPPAATASKPGATPGRLTDRVLQRAVHLHRALQALKKG